MEGALDSYLSHCRPYEFAAPWDCIIAGPLAYRGPASPETALATLTANYTVEVLLASGVAKRGDADTLSINTLLSEPHVPLIGLRGGPNGGVVNLLTSNGCIAGGELPLFAGLLDATTYDPERESYCELFLTANLADAMVLRSLSMVAIPVFGLTQLKKKGVDRLCKTFGLNQYIANEERARSESASHSPNADGTHSAAGERGTPVANCLVLVNWSPSTLSSAAPEINSAIEHLRKLNRFYGIEITNILEWVPEQEELERIKYAVGQRDVDWIRARMSESSAESAYYLDEDPPDTAPAPKSDLSDAVKRLLKHNPLESVPKSDLSDAVKRLFKHNPLESVESALKRHREAIADFDEIIGGDFIADMYRDAHQTANPVKRIGKLQLAHLMELSHSVSLEMRPCTKGTRRAIGRLAGSHAELSKEPPMSQYLRISDQILKYAKWIRT